MRIAVGPVWEVYAATRKSVLKQRPVTMVMLMLVVAVMLIAMEQGPVHSAATVNTVLNLNSVMMVLWMLVVAAMTLVLD